MIRRREHESELSIVVVFLAGEEESQRKLIISHWMALLRMRTNENEQCERKKKKKKIISTLFSPNPRHFFSSSSERSCFLMKMLMLSFFLFPSISHFHSATYCSLVPASFALFLSSYFGSGGEECWWWWRCGSGREKREREIRIKLKQKSKKRRKFFLLQKLIITRAWEILMMEIFPSSFTHLLALSLAYNSRLFLRFHTRLRLLSLCASRARTWKIFIFTPSSQQAYTHTRKSSKNQPVFPSSKWFSFSLAPGALCFCTSVSANHHLKIFHLFPHFGTFHTWKWAYDAGSGSREN